MSVEIFKALAKINEDSGTLSDNNLSSVTEWIDTGSYALNVILSGSMYKGAPKGRIIGFAGPSMSGKSYIITKIIGNFLREDKSHWGLLFDSEAAADANMARNVGADPDRIKVFPVETIESCKHQVVTFLDAVIAKGPVAYGKYIIGIDSLGNLASQKEITDAETGKTASDMGLRAKTIKSFMRVITYKAAKAGVTILFTNHTYEDPTAMFASLVKEQSGGKGPIYLASILVQLSVTQEKTKTTKDKETGKKVSVAPEGAISPLAHRVSGANLSALTIKNRFIPQFLKTELNLNFITGLDLYSGLLDMLLGYNVITQSGSTYSVGDQALGRYKVWSKKPDVWATLLPLLEAELASKLTYNNESAVLDEIEADVTALEDE